VLLFLIALLVGGLIIGALARLALPGPDPMPIWMTALLGIAGSILGGIASQLFFGRAGGFLFALLGAILLLFIYRRFVEHRPLTGPEARLPRRRL
jgi:uncharacterized membrane protein YeaQ/YmgE (transglycosylase-associated protein family)